MGLSGSGLEASLLSLSFLSSQVLKGPAQVTEHPQNALELASGHRVRVLTSFHEKQSYVFDALGETWLWGCGTLLDLYFYLEDPVVVVCWLWSGVRENRVVSSPCGPLSSARSFFLWLSGSLPVTAIFLPQPVTSGAF